MVLYTANFSPVSYKPSNEHWTPYIIHGTLYITALAPHSHPIARPWTVLLVQRRVLRLGDAASLDLTAKRMIQAGVQKVPHPSKVWAFILPLLTLTKTEQIITALQLMKLKAGRERDDRGWDGWMASPTQWTWVWVKSGSWWWTGRPDVL